MEPRTFEGTWEEIARLGAELAGRKVRLTVLDEPGAPVMLDCALAHIVEAAERLTGSLPPVAPSPRADDWSQEVLDKYRRLVGVHYMTLCDVGPLFALVDPTQVEVHQRCKSLLT